jgi:hypothetical protein
VQELCVQAAVFIGMELVFKRGTDLYSELLIVKSKTFIPLTHYISKSSVLLVIKLISNYIKFLWN